MSEHSVHLIWRRGSETLDCRVEGIAKNASHFEIKAHPSNDGSLNLEFAARLHDDAVVGKGEVQQATIEPQRQRAGSRDQLSGVWIGEVAGRDGDCLNARQCDISGLGLGSFRQQGLHGQTNHTPQNVQGYASVTAGQFSAMPPIKREGGK